MLLSIILILLTPNALNSKREVSLYYSRIAILVLISNFIIKAQSVTLKLISLINICTQLCAFSILIYLFLGELLSCFILLGLGLINPIIIIHLWFYLLIDLEQEEIFNLVNLLVIENIKQC